VSEIARVTAAVEAEPSGLRVASHHDGADEQGV
jgi:hypothetical protein